MYCSQYFLKSNRPDYEEKPVPDQELSFMTQNFVL